MIEAMKQWREAFKDFKGYRPDCDEALKSMDQAIAEAEKQEPKCVVIVEVFGKDWRLEYMSLPVGRHKLYTQQYLYTHPQPKREPLTDEQVEKIIKANMSLQMNLAGIRQDFEAAHGIKE